MRSPSARRDRPSPLLVGQDLAIDPSGSDEETLELYRARLQKMRRGSAKACDIAQFREVNRSIENRLREAVPQLMGPIDAVYAWAARHAR